MEKNMERDEVIQFIKETLDKVPAKQDGTHSDFDCDFLLTELEKIGTIFPASNKDKELK
jgi:hypothetical protein